MDVKFYPLAGRRNLLKKPSHGLKEIEDYGRRIKGEGRLGSRGE